MKIMIASDIHGSEKYMVKLLDAYKRSGAKKLVLLGDILYHGPRNDLSAGYNPKAVIEILNGIKEELLCVRGNCDTEVDQMVLEFPIMSDYAVLSDGEKMIYLTHGHKYGVDYFPNAKAGDMIIQGHTHIPMDEVRNGIRCVNPGSVALPKCGSNHQCLIYENGEFEIILLD